MMKRPWILYLIAVWTLFQKPFFATIPLSIIAHELGFRVPLPGQLSSVVMLAILVVLFCLARLQPFARITVIVFLAAASIVIVRVFTFMVMRGNSAITGEPYSAWSYVSLVIRLGVNVLAGAYLCRPTIAAMCREKQRSRSLPTLAEINAELIKHPPKM